MPELNETLAHFLHVKKFYRECVVPTGTRVRKLWFDMNDAEEKQALEVPGFGGSFQRHGLVGELKEKYHIERMKALLWPSHVNPLELSLEDVDYNCRSLFLKFRGLDGEETWMGVCMSRTYTVWHFADLCRFAGSRIAHLKDTLFDNGTVVSVPRLEK